MSYEYLVIINADVVPVEAGSGHGIVAELSELSWVIVQNGFSSSPSSSSDSSASSFNLDGGILDKQQLFILPEHANVDLGDISDMENGVTPYEAFYQVR